MTREDSNHFAGLLNDLLIDPKIETKQESINFLIKGMCYIFKADDEHFDSGRFKDVVFGK